MHLIPSNHKPDRMSSKSQTMFSDPPNDDMWKKFNLEMVTPPLSPNHDGSGDMDLENMPFDLDTEDLMLFDDENIFETMKELTFPSSSHSPDFFDIQDNLIHDIMWSATPSASKGSTETDVTGDSKKAGRNRCDSCSGPFKTACVAPEDVFPGVTQIGGTLSQTRINGLGIETPSDSEEEIDVVTVEKQYQVSVPGKRKQRTEDHQGTKTVTLTIEHKATSGSQTVHKKCNTPIIRQKVDCPTDVHNYSLPMTSLKRVRAFLSTQDTPHKSSKKLKRDNSVPSDLRKVAQKLKQSSSIGSSGSGSCSSSRSSSDSEDFGDSGKRTQHNVLERKRRTDLKNSFFILRDSVPELEGQERAPKVLILRKASQYILKLIEDERKYNREKDLLKTKREKLKRHLTELRDY